MKSLISMSIALCVGIALACPPGAHAQQPDYAVWKAERIKTLAAGGQVMRTKLGDIEYADVGEGIPGLSLHGTPGGYEVAVASRAATPAAEIAGTRMISVSRPGYLRTPVGSGRSFEQQADLFAALLDELKIDRVVVTASSGGSYAALQFALRHPDRCIALVMFAPALGHEPMPEGIVYDAAAFQAEDKQMRMIADAPPTAAFPGYDPKTAEERAFLKTILLSRTPVDMHFVGRRNDFLQRSDRKVGEWPLEKIKVPVLIIHGTMDENSDYNLSVEAVERIPNAKLVTLEGVDHFFPITRAAQTRRHVRDFLSKIPGATPSN
jgi:pimeloyl-ACP methyl ester carboxylesterase